MSSPSALLRSMEALASHVILELLQVRDAQEAAAQADAAEDEKTRVKQEKAMKKEQQQRAKQEKIKAEQTQSAAASVKHEAGVKAEPSAAGAASAPAPLARSASAGAASRRPSTRHRQRAKRTVVIQYAPDSKENSSRDAQGHLQSHVPMWTPSAEEIAADSAPGLHPSSRWAATPLARSRGKRKNNSSQGGSGSQTAASQEDGGSQQLDDELDEDAEQNREVNGKVVKMIQLVYPSRHGHRMLAALLKNMSACYAKILCSSRDQLRALYYVDKPLFKTQPYSDDILRRLSAMLQVQRDELNVCAGAKGFIMGEVSYEVHVTGLAPSASDSSSSAPAHSAVQHVNCELGPQLITPCTDQIKNIQISDRVTWMLIVEKETIFSQLAQNAFSQLHGCLIVTDKGMPSIATRRFLRRFSEEFPTIPMFGLFDADPFGVGIFAEYKYGSAKSARENIQLSDMQWLGLSVRDLDDMGALQKTKLRLTKRDRTRAGNLLKRDIGQKDEVIRRELETQLEWKCKAELEALSSMGENFLSSTYIMSKMRQLQHEAEQREAERSRSQSSARVGIVKVQPAAPILTGVRAFAEVGATPTSTASTNSSSWSTSAFDDEHAYADSAAYAYAEEPISTTYAAGAGAIPAVAADQDDKDGSAWFM